MEATSVVKETVLSMSKNIHSEAWYFYISGLPSGNAQKRQIYDQFLSRIPNISIGCTELASLVVVVRVNSPFRLQLLLSPAWRSRSDLYLCLLRRSWVVVHRLLCHVGLLLIGELSIQAKRVSAGASATLGLVRRKSPPYLP